VIFTTHIAARHPILSAMYDDGTSVWTAIHLNLTQPWFICAFTKIREKGALETVLMTDLRQLADLKSRVGIDIEGLQMMLVSPEWMNGSRPWALEPLQQVWRGRTRSKDPQVVTRYVVGANKQYRDTRVGRGHAVISWERVL
jgi:hypothetical protein